MPEPIARTGGTAEGVRGLTRLWRGRSTVAVSTGWGGLEPVVARVLASRGLSAGEAAETFLKPTLRLLHEPSLIPDLDRAAERILAAARGGERIVIYGDYDVDGVSATAILFHILHAVAKGVDLVTYVPHRIDEGYGLNTDAIRQLAAEGARVIVSVDCGVTAVEPARAARAAGVDLIITDHHNPPASMKDLPDAFAVVHPRRPDSAYPFGELCGAGVAYKLAWRTATLAAAGGRVSAPIRELLVELLGLASLGVIADVVPLVDENRVIARFGLSRIRSSSIPGLRALVEASGLAGENVGEEEVGFKLGPRLNACGRMGHAREAVELLTTATGERAMEIAKELSRLNDERRRLEQRIAEHAAELAGHAGMTGPDRRAIVLAHEEWHPGVVGIVCSRLVERFCRPVILMQRRDGRCHGSGRSVDGFSLHGALEACRGQLTQFGGHDMAAGLVLQDDRLGEFTEAFIAHANSVLSSQDLVRGLGYDCDATLDELSVGAVEQLRRLGPFGRENPPVRVRVRGVRIGRGRLLGAAGRHLALEVSRGDAAMRLVAWGWGEHAPTLVRGRVIDVVITPKISTWTGNATVEAEIQDVLLIED